MAKGKMKSSSAPAFAKGGGKAPGKNGAGPAKPGVTSQEGSAGGKFAKGGGGSPSKPKATPAKAGQTGR